MTITSQVDIENWHRKEMTKLTKIDDHKSKLDIEKKRKVDIEKLKSCQVDKFSMSTFLCQVEKLTKFDDHKSKLQVLESELT